MDTVTLQVPMSKTLRGEAAEVASSYGFSSLQDLIRLFLTKVANRQLAINVVERFPVVELSKKNEKRYLKMEKDFKEGKNIYHAKSVNEFLSQLDS